jgi:hypothetical protein
VPPVTGIKADGTDQSVTGQTYDQISVRIVNLSTLQVTFKKKARIVATDEISADESGNRLTSIEMNYPENAQPFKETVLFTRVEKGPAGSHATLAPGARKRLMPRRAPCSEPTK